MEEELITISKKTLKAIISDTVVETIKRTKILTLKPKQYAEQKGINPSTVHRQIKKGLIKTNKNGEIILNEL